MRHAPSLRPATAEDAALLREIFVAGRRGDFAALNWPEPQLQLLLAQQFAAQAQHYRLQFPDAVDHIVCCGDAEVGRLYLHHGSDELRVIDIALLPGHQGAGIGTALLQQLQAEAAQRRLPLRLSVVQGNPAIRLYRRLGFEPCGTDEVYVEMEWRPARRPSPA